MIELNYIEILKKNNLLPFTEGLEDDTVLLDITNYNTIESQNKLKAFLNSLNTSQRCVYYGRRLYEHKHHGRMYIQTGWDTDSETYKSLLNCDLYRYGGIGVGTVYG